MDDTERVSAETMLRCTRRRTSVSTSLAQATLADGQRGHVLPAFPVARRPALSRSQLNVPATSSRCRGGETLRAVSATAAAATATLLRLLVVPAEGTDLEEVDVARRLVAAAIPRGRVVGDEVAGLQSELLEKERVGGAGIERGSPGRRITEGDPLLRPSVDTVVKLEPADAIVIGCAQRRW